MDILIDTRLPYHRDLILSAIPGDLFGRPLLHGDIEIDLLAYFGGEFNLPLSEATCFESVFMSL